MSEHRELKIEIQVSFVVLAIVIALAMLFSMFEGNVVPKVVSAKELESYTPSTKPTGTIELTMFHSMNTTGTLGTGILPFDLAIIQQTNATVVNSGDVVTFTNIIFNDGPNPINYVFFEHIPPPELRDISYEFEMEVLGNGGNDTDHPTWLILEPIPIDTLMRITVTGKLVSSRDVTVTNTSRLEAFNSKEEIVTTNNSASVNIGIITSDPIPTPTPSIGLVYYDDFSQSGNWIPLDEDCNTESISETYQISLPSQKQCSSAAPASAETQYGTFRVEARHATGGDDFSYGIYINREDENQFYLLKVQPNSDSCNDGGDWSFYRHNTKALEATCDPNIQRGALGNTLELNHLTHGEISISVNGMELGTYQDENPYIGKGTGIYVESSQDDVTIQFDNFFVFTNTGSIGTGLLPFDLTIIQQTNVTTVTSGEIVTFTHTISNLGPYPAYYVFFENEPPPELHNISYDFEMDVLTDGGNNPDKKVWLLYDPVVVNKPLHITVTGELTTPRNVTVINTSKIHAFGMDAESNAKNPLPRTLPRKRLRPRGRQIYIIMKILIIIVILIGVSMMGMVAKEDLRTMNTA
ncbi:MAG: hypothetical protein B6242_10115 [Anaerolineaceae bacterium 4572_78]|nr:MAG: hypothetical protein B6242_10115 [Anaerolineaceae bacterium 4572_78]